MIAVTKLNHVGIVLNSDLIEYIENTPDTVITLTTGQKMMVLETADVIVDRVTRFRRSLLDGACPLTSTAARAALPKGAPV